MSSDLNDKDILLHELKADEHGLQMSLSGEPAKMFMHLLIQFFKENGGENYLTMEVHDENNKYEITIVNQNGQDTPSEKLYRQEMIISRYEEALKTISKLDNEHMKDAIMIAKEAIKNSVKQKRS